MTEDYTQFVPVCMCACVYVTIELVIHTFSLLLLFVRFFILSLLVDC